METEQAVEALGALAQDTRLAIYRHLVEAGHDGCRAGLIADSLALPNATLSFHLSQLRQAGLVSARREGRQIIYAADYPTMTSLIEYLTANCCAGRERCDLPGSTPPRRDGPRAGRAA